MPAIIIGARYPRNPVLIDATTRRKTAKAVFLTSKFDVQCSMFFELVLGNAPSQASHSNQIFSLPA